jgi:hypothetical protein
MLVGVSPSVLRVLQACPRNNGPYIRLLHLFSIYYYFLPLSPHPSLPFPVLLTPPSCPAFAPVARSQSSILHSLLSFTVVFSLTTRPPSLRTHTISGLGPRQLRPINGSPSYSTCSYTAASFPPTRSPPRLFAFASPHSNKTGGFLHFILTVPLTLPHPPRFTPKRAIISRQHFLFLEAGAILSSHSLPS